MYFTASSFFRWSPLRQTGSDEIDIDAESGLARLDHIAVRQRAQIE
jgi:hypothetical protein